MSRLAKDEKGIAMSEGVIVVPFFLAIWIGLIGVHALLEGRLEARLEADSRALATASSGECGDSDMSLDEMEQTSGTETGMDTSIAGMLAEIAGCDPLSWAHAEVVAVEEVDGVPARLGGPTLEVAEGAVLMCTTEPVDGLLDLVADVVGDALGLDDE